jgi:uncharacterized membrane protein YbhN (UPF0104 family)
MPFYQLFKTVLTGSLVGHYTSQVIGDYSIRVAYLKTQGVELKKGSLIFSVDKALEVLLCVTVWVVFLVWLFWKEKLRCPDDGYPLAAAGLFYLLGMSFPYAARVVKAFWNKNGMTVPQQLFSSRSWQLMILLTLSKYVAVTLRYLCVLSLCGISLGFPKCFLGNAWAQLGLMVGVTPSGLGFVEAGWAGALHYFEMPASLAAKFLVAQRLLSLGALIILAVLMKILEAVVRCVSHMRAKK